MRKKKEKLPEPEVEASEEEEKAVEEVIEKPLSFDEFYSEAQGKIDFSSPCHPDWYMLGASPSQYPLSDESLESPEQAYQRYLKEKS